MSSEKVSNTGTRHRQSSNPESTSAHNRICTSRDTRHADVSNQNNNCTLLSKMRSDSRCRRKRRRQWSRMPSQSNRCHNSWRDMLFLVMLFEATILISASAHDFLGVDNTSGDNRKQRKRRERIARNLQILSEEQQYDKPTPTASGEFTYKVRPRTKLPAQKDTFIDIDDESTTKRNLQRKWVFQKDLQSAFSTSEDIPSAFSNDQIPSAFSDDRPTVEPTALPPEPTKQPFTLPPFPLPLPTAPTTIQPTTPQPSKGPDPTVPPITLPPFTLPPFPVETARPTRRFTRKPTPNPTEKPTFPEPSPVQEPGGGEPLGPPEPGGDSGSADPPEPGDNPTIAEPGGGSNDPISLPTSSPSLLPTGVPTSVNAPGGGGSEPGAPEGGGNEPGSGGNQPGSNEPDSGGNGPGPLVTFSPSQVPSILEPPGGSEPGSNEPDSNEPGGNEPGSNEPGGNEPDVGEPGGNEPSANEPGSNEPNGNEPDVGEPGGNEPSANEPGSNEPNGNEPGGNQPGANEPGSNEPGGNEPNGGEPGANEPGGNEPGGNEPNGGEPGGNEPGANEPGGNEPAGGEPGGNQPAEPNVDRNESPAFAPVEIPSDRGNEPEESGVPVNLIREPVTMSIAALNSASSYAYTPAQPTPASKDENIYSPGSPEWNKERIIVAEVPRFELQLTVSSETRELRPPLEDTSVLEVLTSEHMLNYSNSILGSNLLAIDGLVLRNIIVTGEVRQPPRKLFENIKAPSIKKSASKTLEFGSQEQPFTFSFQAKFIFMHWTKIAWALDLPGLSENLVIASLSGDQKANYLTTLQSIPSFNHTDGKVKDFLFASTTDVLLAPSSETSVEEAPEKEETKVLSPFVKPKFPAISALAFACLGLSIALCLLRWRIERKRQNWLKKGGEADNDDEITILFSDANEELELLKPSDKTFETADKTLEANKTHRDEVIVICSDSSEETEKEKCSVEQPQTAEFKRDINWRLDYLIYDDENKDKRSSHDDDEEDDDTSDATLNSENPTKRIFGTASSVASMSDFVTSDASTCSSTRDSDNDLISTALSPPPIKRKFISVLEPKTPSSRGDVWRNRIVALKEQKLQRKETETRQQSSKTLPNSCKGTRRGELGKETRRVSNQSLNNNKRDNSRGGADDRYESFTVRRGGLDKTTQHASNLSLDKHGLFTTRTRGLEEDTQHVSNLTIDSKRNSMKCGYFF